MKFFAALLLGMLMTLDPHRSTMTVHVYKQGLFSFLADNHIISAPLASGTFNPDRKSVTIVVNAAHMRVLDPRLSADRRNTVQSTMLGPQVLDVAKYPRITFQSTRIDASGKNTWTVTGNLTLRGQTHSLTFTAHSAGSNHITGSATVRQTTFGITPIRIAGGAVSVKDDVRVDFDVTFAATR